MFAFSVKYKELSEILKDHKLAALGDAYVNFLYSLALSKRRGEPVGDKVNSRILAWALKKAGLRELLPSRTDRHKQADAAEALIVYAWIKRLITIEEGVDILGQSEDITEGFCSFLSEIKRRLKEGSFDQL